ncbi:MAG: hypothetical protein P4L53_06305 [Candidatus Obscuribacterales bacterium]|nr:hypothetical protein [Candidatus Obscuribacterales bacterium]
MPSKLCPRCSQKDNTDFSTCRFCGFKYGDALPKPKTENRFKIGSWPFIVVLCITLYTFKIPLINAVGYVATGGKQKNVLGDAAVDFATGTAGAVGLEPNKFKSELLDMVQIVESNKPLDEAMIKRRAESDQISIDEERTKLLKYRTNYRQKHHLD